MWDWGKIKDAIYSYFAYIHSTDAFKQHYIISDCSQKLCILYAFGGKFHLMTCMSYLSLFILIVYCYLYGYISVKHDAKLMVIFWN